MASEFLLHVLQRAVADPDLVIGGAEEVQAAFIGRSFEEWGGEIESVDSVQKTA